MPFDLRAVALLIAAALLYGLLLPVRWRGWALLLGSLFGVYWLQPDLPIRFSDYIFPTASILLAVGGWWLTRPPDAEPVLHEDRAALLLILLFVVGLSFTRFLQPELRLTSYPPHPLVVGGVLVGIAAVSVPLTVAQRDRYRTLLTVGILLILLLFVVLKSEWLTVSLSEVWRVQTGRDPTLAAVTDFAWLGFSYIAFRLIHTLRDRQAGRLPSLTLREYLTYVLFFPAIVAGPIDRAERFVKDLRALAPGIDAARLTEGLTRIAVGAFKKFGIADSLALIALNPTNAAQAESALGLWILLYGYAFRLYFDFSGYSDIAIGLGVLFGVKLPENFDRPYLKSDIASFWQSWHITLSTWARFYVFTPLSRLLLTRQPKPSPLVVVFSAQLTTMLVIGLWHGVTWNFFIWGLWHGLGLFIHKQWSDRTRKVYLSLRAHPWRKRAWTFAAWLLTFHFVVLGWVWFALPEFEQSVRVFAGLFGGR